MSKVLIDFSKGLGKIKPMHAVNNGPQIARGDQTRGNSVLYAEAKIPYARTHDAAFYAPYGGEHTVDIGAVFPNFDADVNDEASYDFACTDNYMKQIYSVGTKPFYRLGSKIEHEVKKYGTLPPKDFLKWAQICEHIIMHYTEGWANGFFYDMEYWEIWNEPDLDPDDSTNKRCWGGTEAEFTEFFITASTYLKARFPHLKIGGPAIAWNEDWLERFFERIERVNGKRVPLDFLSWHWYGTEPRKMSEKGTRICEIARRFGYEGFESILNEWNYVRGWGDEWIYSIEQMIGIKGASFITACMCEGQKNPAIDMLMYYDARPCAMNGMFDFYTMRALKGYYPFVMFSRLFELGEYVSSESDDTDIYTACATNGKSHSAIICYYTDDDNAGNKEISISIDGASLDGAKVYLLDESYSMNELSQYKIKDNALSLKVRRNSVIFIEKTI